MLITRAGFGLGGTPATGTPAAHSTPATMSSNVPPHLPSTRTGRIFAFQLRPAMPTPLLVFAAMRPLTNVPCQAAGLARRAVAAFVVGGPVARIGGIVVATVAVVGHCRVADEVVTGQYASGELRDVA